MQQRKRSSGITTFSMIIMALGFVEFFIVGIATGLWGIAIIELVSVAILGVILFALGKIIENQYEMIELLKSNEGETKTEQTIKGQVKETVPATKQYRFR